jgi:Zn-dependent protease with chaperone function
VLQRGSLIHQLQDRGERVLILGMASLNDLSQGQLRAILAHEYGHFTNRDTDSSTITR